MGAEAFALGANWPQLRQSHWRALAMARAIENDAQGFLLLAIAALTAINEWLSSSSQPMGQGVRRSARCD